MNSITIYLVYHLVDFHQMAERIAFVVAVQCGLPIEMADRDRRAEMGGMDFHADSPLLA